MIVGLRLAKIYAVMPHTAFASPSTPGPAPRPTTAAAQPPKLLLVTTTIHRVECAEAGGRGRGIGIGRGGHSWKDSRRQDFPSLYKHRDKSPLNTLHLHTKS